MIFIIILTITGIGLFSYIQYAVKGTKVQEIKPTKAYYSAIAGLRYATILLRDPGICFTTPEDPSDLEEYTVTGVEFGGDFFGDIGMKAGELTLTITIKEISTGEYEVKAACHY